MALIDETDDSLMRRVRSGERSSLSILLRRFAGPVMTFIHRSGVPAQNREEVFQEVFLAVWTHRRKFRLTGRFRPWLFGITANKCRAARRQRRSSVELPDDDPRWTGVGAAPVDDLIQGETSELVAAAVAKLPPRQREVIVMRVWNGMSYADIAAAINRTESTVRTNMSAGLTALRNFLEPRMRS